MSSMPAVSEAVGTHHCLEQEKLIARLQRKNDDLIVKWLVMTF